MTIVEDTLRRTGLLAVAILGLTTAAMAQDTAARLKELQSLYDQKLITETEFQSRRQGLLDAVAPAIAPTGNGGSPVPAKAFDLKDVQGKWKQRNGRVTIAAEVTGNALKAMVQCAVGTALPGHITAKIDEAGLITGQLSGNDWSPRPVTGTWPHVYAEPRGSCGAIDTELMRE